MNAKEHRENIGKLIRTIRIEKGISQTELAARMNVNQQNISEYENGKKLPSPEWIWRACKSMDQDIIEFYRRLYHAP